MPVEFDASRRALEKLQDYKIVDNSEFDGAKEVLTAAALTYVAGVLASMLQIFRLILAAKDREDR